MFIDLCLLKHVCVQAEVYVFVWFHTVHTYILVFLWTKTKQWLTRYYFYTFCILDYHFVIQQSIIAILLSHGVSYSNWYHYGILYHVNYYCNNIISYGEIWWTMGQQLATSRKKIFPISYSELRKDAFIDKFWVR